MANMKKIIREFMNKYVDEIANIFIQMEQVDILERKTISYAAMNLHLKYTLLKLEICKALMGENA